MCDDSQKMFSINLLPQPENVLNRLAALRLVTTAKEGYQQAVSCSD
jgi:hypothetical protein